VKRPVVQYSSALKFYETLGGFQLKPSSDSVADLANALIFWEWGLRCSITNIDEENCSYGKNRCVNRPCSDGESLTSNSYHMDLTRIFRKNLSRTT
jgi:hypothetical protein